MGIMGIILNNGGELLKSNVLIHFLNKKIKKGKINKVIKRIYTQYIFK